jgi:hypothetical protein
LQNYLRNEILKNGGNFGSKIIKKSFYLSVWSIEQIFKIKN